MIGLLTPYTIDVTARTASGGEVRLQRTLQTVAIPVFQFGMFSDVDLSFFAGPNFNFGGRVHTNGNLFLAEGGGATLTIGDRTTAVGEVVRQQMSNGVAITVPSTHDGTVKVMTAPGATRSLAATEGSVTGGLGSSANPNWTTISLSTYNGNLRNGTTGAKRLDLPLITAGGSNPDLVKRPAAGEDTSNALLYGQRSLTQASVRILLSDTRGRHHRPARRDRGRPGPPRRRLGDDAPDGLYAERRVRPPGDRPRGLQRYLSASGTGLIGGYIKIERQDTSGNWHDVTLEILNLGIASRDLSNSGCSHPSANAVIRLQRVKDGVSSCGTTTTTSTNFWPQTLFDPREALFRDAAPATPPARRRDALRDARREQPAPMAAGDDRDERHRHHQQQRLHRVLLGLAEQPRPVRQRDGRVRVRRLREPERHGHGQRHPRHWRGRERERHARDLRAISAERAVRRGLAAHVERAALDAAHGRPGEGEPGDPLPARAEAGQRRARQHHLARA